jgi:hypothetical protein
MSSLDISEPEFPPCQLSSISAISWQSAGRPVAPLWHIILIPSQPVFALTPHTKFVPTPELPHSRKASLISGGVCILNKNKVFRSYSDRQIALVFTIASMQLSNVFRWSSWGWNIVIASRLSARTHSTHGCFRHGLLVTVAFLM